MIDLTMQRADEIRADLTQVTDCAYASVKQNRGDTPSELIAKASETIMMILMAIARRDDELEEAADDLAVAALAIRNEIYQKRYTQKKY